MYIVKNIVIVIGTGVSVRNLKISRSRYLIQIWHVKA